MTNQSRFNSKSPLLSEYQEPLIRHLHVSAEDVCDEKLLEFNPIFSPTNTTTNSNKTFSLSQVLKFVLTFLSDDSGEPRHIYRGLSTIFFLGAALGLILPNNYSFKLQGFWYPHFSSIIGYTYFTAWSISFYPQLLLNFRKKNTKGLSVDFCYMNVLGFLCYAIFNVSMYYSKNLQQQYAIRHNLQPIKVAPNDVAFAIHALLLSMVWVLQIWHYDGKNNPIKRPSTITLVCIASILVTCVTYALLILVVHHFGHDGNYYGLNWLDYMYTLANFKVFITFVKYCPQVILNARRKSTQGWNIWNILLDFTGGILSVTQLVLDCWNTHDWSGITGYPAKFLLGCVSILFDITFFVQHYVLYPQQPEFFFQEVIDADEEDDDESCKSFE